ncbi:AAA-domain-containing protein [Stemphylium lycopersici]|uniref:AAA-domain-containing protein n=1 Tax=Stemphylium lycopersici TaxID=183478 RepID=A0A364NDU3_STELY|nr:AAA-domain-containing protein [Stemphylium lycopersici]
MGKLTSIMSSHASAPGKAANAFEDLTGISTSAFDNPYDALIAACEDDPEKYQLHRTTRNAQQKAKMLDQTFPGVTIDSILLRQQDPTVEPGFQDPRHCFVFWGRPTQKVKDMIHRVQQELLTVAPILGLWLMPQDNLHITVLEVTHSKTAPEIEKLVEITRDKIPAMTDYTYNHRTRLIKPLIGYDASALALSFVPAAGEGLHSGRTSDDDKFTYHHLRRDMFSLCSDAGVQVESRYVVPSSHLTIGRFIYSKDLEDDNGTPDPLKVKALINKIEEINGWLEKEFWPEHNDGKIPDGGEFNVGQEKGLHCGTGTLCCRDSVGQADFAFYACSTASRRQGFIGPERWISAPVSSAIAAETIPRMVSAPGSMQRLREHHNCAAASLPNASPTASPTGASSTEAEEPLETESPLPGIKRGIAIGVACSVSVILIAILAIFAIRRRNRALARGAKQKNLQTEDTGAEFGSQEKTWWMNTPPSPPPPAILPPPPVEADAHTIYELDAGHMPELHGETCPQEVEGSGESHSTSQEADEQYAQKLKQWREWEIASDADPSPTVRPTHWDLPLLTVSPPETSRGDVSPLLRSSWGPTSNGPSPISPPQNAHFQSGRLP